MTRIFGWLVWVKQLLSLSRQKKINSRIAGKRCVN
jgi:hypothetical protein